MFKVSCLLMIILNAYQQKQRGQEHLTFTLITQSSKIKPQITAKPGPEKQNLLLKQIKFSSNSHQVITSYN